jgi:hypothetical protein
MAVFLIHKGTDHVHVRQSGDKVLLLRGGTLITEIPWKAALTLSKAIRIKAKQAEEEAKALDIIDDQALMMRVGMPIGLTDDPVKIKEAVKEASWNSKLRKYIPIAKFGAIESKERFGTPAIIKKKPKPKKDKQE